MSTTKACVCLFALSVVPALACAGAEVEAASPKARATEWVVSPSLQFDVLCLLNTLTGDSFYLKYYRPEYDELSRKLAPQALEALSRLKRRIKDENGNIISAFLTLYLSATDGEGTMEGVLRGIADSRRLQANLKKTPYYSEDGWRLYESVRPDLAAVLRALKTAGFEGYWKMKILPIVQRRISELKMELSAFDVVSEVDRVLAAPLPSNRITVYVLYFSQPHGIKITGTRFLTDVAWPTRIVVRNAVHEMMHPPFDLQRDVELREALDTLRADPLLDEKLRNHNPSLGYNSFEGLVEEDCVQALDQLIAERLGMALSATERWKSNDDGMHVLAAALYVLMREENPTTPPPLRDFLLRNIRSGRLAPGRVEILRDRLFASP